MRVVYLYTREARIKPEQCFTDGHFDLLAAMQKKGIVDDVAVYWEDYSLQQKEIHRDDPHFKVYSVPSIHHVEILPGDVIWIRGGWKCWLPRIEKWLKTHWIMYYGANTGHERWPFWDIVLEDCRDHIHGIDAHNRLWVRYRKPISKEFYYKKQPFKYDLCIGASYLSKRKGQYRSWEVAKAYQEKYGDLRGVMPAKTRRLDQISATMYEEIKNVDFIELPGFLERRKLAQLFNQTKVFIHMGGGGQNDRSVLEACACGCHIILISEKWHPKFFTLDPSITYVTGAKYKTENVIDRIREFVQQTNHHKKKRIANFFHRHNGIELNAIPLMSRLFNFFRKKEKSRENLQELYEKHKRHL